ncbi:uncharacterized protein G2W53_007301 [Senna tora]|uniref:Uncharacterized protein n=1 Tax=Senna tora TaxID=362788 RepID=A0A834X6V5_9FABA|nr:uncharacterized protein G2W53_007301 [Senna tora]
MGSARDDGSHGMDRRRREGRVKVSRPTCGAVTGRRPD